jgi:hypothetical protein
MRRALLLVGACFLGASVGVDDLSAFVDFAFWADGYFAGGAEGVVVGAAVAVDVLADDGASRPLAGGDHSAAVVAFEAVIDFEADGFGRFAAPRWRCAGRGAGSAALVFGVDAFPVHAGHLDY